MTEEQKTILRAMARDGQRAGLHMNEFERDRSALSGLHFAQDAMRDIERATLHGAERMLARCDAVLAIHQPKKGNVIGAGYKVVEVTVCSECTSRWPCPTVQAITGDE